MSEFKATSSTFQSTPEAMLIPLRDIDPPFRFPEHPNNCKGFNRDRMIYILNGISRGDKIKPVHLWKVPPPSHHEFFPCPIRYQVLDGYHRYYASVAAGYEYLPASIDDINLPNDFEK
ncbi:MAG: hypothetical protein PHU14_12690 [Methylovulum sp.]|nr:hypothetical protein [Methylovulum sp.]